MILTVLALAVYGGALATAVMTDVMTLRIPNWISALLAGAFFVAAALVPKSVDWASHLSAGVIVLLAGMGLFAWGKIGGGDVKLLAAVSLWNGLALLPSLVLTVGIAGGGVALACLVLRRIGLGPLLAARGFQAASLAPDKGIPYAAAIAVGCGMLAPHLFLF
jgi:prepilin peptidase CpaA